MCTLEIQYICHLYIILRTTRTKVKSKFRFLFSENKACAQIRLSHWICKLLHKTAPGTVNLIDVCIIDSIGKPIFCVHMDCMYTSTKYLDLFSEKTKANPAGGKSCATLELERSFRNFIKDGLKKFIDVVIYIDFMGSMIRQIFWFRAQ